MNNPHQALGSRISLISKSEIRYEGFLHAINAEENTVALKNVRMYGTEGRKGDPSQEIAPGDQMYDFIIFRGADIQDLTVFEDPQPRDPAIVRSKPASAPAPKQMGGRGGSTAPRGGYNNVVAGGNNGGGRGGYDYQRPAPARQASQQQQQQQNHGRNEGGYGREGGYGGGRGQGTGRRDFYDDYSRGGERNNNYNQRNNNYNQRDN
eukprot:PhF_6_TR5138/c1_g1_i1/m.7306/K18749/LSM14, RAP55, SCD6; protein LSM14